MLVYGDLSWDEDTREKLGDLRQRLYALGLEEPGILRHQHLVALLIETGELAQGLADHAMSDDGEDRRSEAADLALAAAQGLAEAMRCSWDSGFAHRGVLPAARFSRLAEMDLPASIHVKLGEGHAFYALYPEAYCLSAAELRGERVRVIGIRSIGAGLSAVVAAAAGAPLPVTVRPGGHPFQRELTLSPELRRSLLAGPEACFAIVDEGPGLSGSSFGSVADFLEDHGVAPERTVFFPSHSGELGPQASDRHRERWSRAKRLTTDFRQLCLNGADPAHDLAGWVRDLTGEAVAPLEEISGGGWRHHSYAGEAAWPPAHAHQERLKFLLRSASGTWLLKFSGLGREGERAFDVARAMQEAGFGPEVAGFRHGFVVSRWLDDARPLADAGIARPALIRHINRYLGWRARHLTAPSSPGASLEALVEMTNHNAAETFGTAPRLQLPADDLAALEARVFRVQTDNRLQPWEWLVTPDGRVLKTDGSDHCRAHDLVGCQDIAWDVAGAAIEFDMSEAETESVIAQVEGADGRPVDRDLLRLLRPCYLAFQTGSYAMAAGALSGWPEEQVRLERRRVFYAGRLLASLNRSV
ncbi:hypothetical protein SAMN05216548_102390 [Faunimonas pinastri]|uniref:Uncharacterized protein n=1 Tax=Faunimonas pinastri TaxID=1855383 RepID=A0A1H9DAX8_9HYPH|nr:hypothetical protein [Faunimonas pinastri]SEQ09973.1 hypothetical protein SAMN05216548_102390 [Faunimonas pinastri]